MEAQMTTIRRTSEQDGPLEIEVAEVGPADGSLILCVHGWPESWHSWRHQMEHFADRGYRVAAMNVRGYGNSSRPTAVSAYRMSELSGDAAAVIDQLNAGEPAIVFGHDWGAPIAWNTARLHPELVRAVAGMSVPYLPATAGDAMDLWNVLYAGRFFYMKYFQEPGVVEAAFEADLPAAVRKVYFGASGDAPEGLWHEERPEDAALLDGLIDPDPVPGWMADGSVEATVASLAAGPLHGVFNRYRAQGLDGDIEATGDPILAQPTCFIGGEKDIVRAFVPGVDLFADPGASCADYRGTTIVAGAGHWVQQERPEATNEALDHFLDGLE